MKKDPALMWTRRFVHTETRFVSARSRGKNIASEPEVQELKRMIRNGELEPGRIRNHLKKGEREEDRDET
jgi:hypothetical protein